MTKLIPEKPALFPWFSKGHQLRYDFFKNKQELLFKLASLQTGFADAPSWELTDARWQTLDQLSKQIDETLYQAKKIPLSKWFNKQSIEFVQRWTTLLESQKTEITLQKVAYLRELVNTPQLFSWTVSYSRYNASLNLALRDMDEAITSFDIDRQISWQKLKKIIKKQQRPSDAICLLSNAVTQIQRGNTLASSSFFELKIVLQFIDGCDKDSFKTYYSGYADLLLSCFKQQLSELESAINQQTDLPDADLINQTLDLLYYIDRAADTRSDLSACYPILLSIFTGFKVLSKKMTPQEIQQDSIQKLTNLLSELAYSNKQWSELETLIDDVKIYQNDILANRMPMTIEEIDKMAKEGSQRHKDIIADGRQFLEKVKEGRIVKGQQRFLTRSKSNDCINQTNHGHDFLKVN